MAPRKASIKETGEEISQEEWQRFDAAVARERVARPADPPSQREDVVHPVSAQDDRRRVG